MLPLTDELGCEIPRRQQARWWPSEQLRWHLRWQNTKGLQSENLKISGYRQLTDALRHSNACPQEAQMPGVSQSWLHGGASRQEPKNEGHGLFCCRGCFQNHRWLPQADTATVSTREGRGDLRKALLYLRLRYELR